MFPQPMVNIVPSNVAQQIVLVQPIQAMQPMQSTHAFQPSPFTGTYVILSNATMANHQTRVLHDHYTTSALNNPYFLSPQQMNGPIVTNQSLYINMANARTPVLNHHQTPCALSLSHAPTPPTTAYGISHPPRVPLPPFDERKNNSNHSNTSSQSSVTAEPPAAHMDTADGFKCDECQRVFVRKVNLNAHKKIHTAFAYVCAFCNKKFARKSNLQQHVRIHTDERPYHCTYCPRTFRQQHSLKGHVRTHTGEKPFECSHCTKRFAAKCNLKVHLRTHTGEKPYQCAPCHKKYASKSGYNAHMRKFHAVDANTAVPSNNNT